MTKKMTFAFLAAFTAALVSLTSCGSKESNSSTTTTTAPAVAVISEGDPRITSKETTSKTETKPEQTEAETKTATEAQTKAKTGTTGTDTETETETRKTETTPAGTTASTTTGNKNVNGKVQGTGTGTATTTAPVETPPAETDTKPSSNTTTATTAIPEVIPDLECLANSHEISIDDLSAEDKAMFEQFIQENELKGRFYDHIEFTDDMPIFYFVPTDELLANEDPRNIFKVKFICMFGLINDIENVFPDFHDYIRAHYEIAYVLIGNYTGKSFVFKDNVLNVFTDSIYDFPFLENQPVFIAEE